MANEEHAVTRRVEVQSYEDAQAEAERIVPQALKPNEYAGILYFLVRPGTSLRATNKDHSPVMVTANVAAAACEQFERMVPLQQVGALAPMSVDAYYQTFRTIEKRAQINAEHLALA